MLRDSKREGKRETGWGGGWYREDDKEGEKMKGRNHIYSVSG